MAIFSFVIVHDTGFAPNPFGGFLTLATCKPQIRKSAQLGDWIVGTGSARTVGAGKLVYAARISKVVPIEVYGRSADYLVKRPSVRGTWWKKHGDNIYTIQDGRWVQRRNRHHFERDIQRDVKGVKVLVCEEFWYFGGSAISIPPRLAEIIKQGRGHKRITDEALINKFAAWLRATPVGVHGRPEMEDASCS